MSEIKISNLTDMKTPLCVQLTLVTNDHNVAVRCITAHETAGKRGLTAEGLVGVGC